MMLVSPSDHRGKWRAESSRCQPLSCLSDKQMAIVLCFPVEVTKQEREFTYKYTNEALSRNRCWRGKTICVWYSECGSVALDIQHGTRTRHIAICSLPRSTVFCPHYLINGTISGKKSLNTKCVFWVFVQLLSETFLVLSRTERDMIKTVYRSACTVPVIVRL